MSDLNNPVALSAVEMDEIFSPAAIRGKARRIFDLTVQGKTSFIYEPEKLRNTVDYVLAVIREKYPDLKIPFHSRWGHFRAGGLDRVKGLDRLLRDKGPLERARAKLDLVISSVLLDAGAGMAWKYFDQESQKSYGRSEGLGLASLAMFLSGEMSRDGQSLQVDAEGLRRVTPAILERHFQVSAANPLVGVEGRVSLLNNLASALNNKSIFRDARPGGILDDLLERFGRSLAAPQILRAVLDGFGPIWPGRLSANGVNLGDVWRYSKLPARPEREQLVPFHKLSQWMTYSLIEPILEAGIEVRGVEDLTGLAEYRNGGLMLDSGLLRLRREEDAGRQWEPGSDLIIEWRALTVHLLDVIGTEVQKALGKNQIEFPLAKVLEGGTWWAGRLLAREKRSDGGPPLNIVSDGTVF